MCIRDRNYDIQNSSNVAGMLLYAKTNEEITPDLETSICGNRIYAKTLDLYTDFKNIASPVSYTHLRIEEYERKFDSRN